MSGDKLEMYLDPEKRTFMFDYSTTSVACDRQLWWGRKLGLQKKRSSEALVFGRAIHKFVERFWLGQPFDDCIAGYYDIARAQDSPLLDEADSEELRTVPRGFQVCCLYAAKYTLMRSTVKPYMLGGKPLVEVPFAFPLGTDNDGWTYIYAGKIDRVELREGKYVWIPDTKTTTRFGPKYWKVLRPNDQITGYVAAVREITGLMVDFAAIDVIAIGKERERVPKDVRDQGQQAVNEYLANVRFEQGPTTRSPEDITTWWDNALEHGVRLRKLWTEHPDNPLYWPMRTSQCGNFGGCEFRDLCGVHGDVEPIIAQDFKKKLWSPFDAEEGEVVE